MEGITLHEHFATLEDPPSGTDETPLLHCLA
jgi:hypothetical protein